MTSQPFFRVLQMLTRWILAVCWIAVTLLATTVLFFGNFVVAWQAFVLMGFEPEPLFAIPLLGPIAAAAGVGDAQLASLYAAALTAAMAVTVISACKFGNDALTLFFDVRQARLAGTVNPAGVIKLYETAIVFAVAIVLAVAVGRYDVSLFSLRLEALVTGMDDIKQSVQWLPDSVARLGPYLADFAARAQWGYLAVIGGVAFTAEKAFQRASERWLVLGQTVDAAILEPTATQPAVGDTPLAPGIGETPSTGVPIPAEKPLVDEAMPVAGPDGAESGRQGAGAPVRPVQPAPAPPVRGPFDAVSTPPPHRGPMVRVICGPGETRDMPLQELERNAEQYVRDGSGRAWFLRTYYDELTGELLQGEAQGNENQDKENREEHIHV